MNDHSEHRVPYRVEWESGVVGLYFLVSLASLALTRNAGGASLLWPANAIAAALLVRVPAARWGRVFAGVLLGGILADVLGAHDTLVESLSLSSIDLLEIVLTLYVFKVATPLSFPDITFAAGIRMLMLLGVGIPALVCLPGAAVVNLTFGAPFAEASLNWFTAASAGAILCAPPIYLYSRKALERLVEPDARVWNLILAAGCLIMTYGSIRFSRFPLITLTLPLVLVAFRAGAFGAALMCEAVGAFVVVLWYFGVRLPGAPVPVTQGALAGLPFVALAAVMISPIVMGFAADDRARATRALLRSLEAARRAERDLAEERERLATTLRAIGDAVITTDPVGLINYANAAAEKLVGQRAEAIVGRRLDDVVVLTNPQSMKSTQSMFALCLARGASVKRPEACLLHRPDGTPCYVVDAASPVQDSEGAVSGVVVVLQDATAAVERDFELNRRATHDPLTGLTNRFELERHLSECFERYRYIQRPATLLMIDLDRFKQVNDTGGHAAGDEVLRRVAQTLTVSVRDSDIVARIGGDEFAILLTHSDPERAQRVGAKVLRAVADLTVEVEGRQHSVGASIGAASLGSGVANLEEWVAAADRACYEAKRAGRGQMRVVAWKSPQNVVQ